MTTKQMIFMSIIISTHTFIMPSEPVFMTRTHPQINLANNYGMSQQRDFIFNDGPNTLINGHSTHDYFMDNTQITPMFQFTRVIEVAKNKTFKEIGTLKSMRKSMYLGEIQRSKLSKHVRMNNAVYCYDVEQVADYDGNLHHVGAILYRTRDINNCSLFKEFLKQQELAENK